MRGKWKSTDSDFSCTLLPLLHALCYHRDHRRGTIDHGPGYKAGRNTGAHGWLKDRQGNKRRSLLRRARSKSQKVIRLEDSKTEQKHGWETADKFRMSTLFWPTIDTRKSDDLLKHRKTNVRSLTKLYTRDFVYWENLQT